MKHVKVANLAEEIYLDLDQPSFFSVTKIASWLRHQVGTLNSFINENYYVDYEDEIVKNTSEYPCAQNNWFIYNPDSVLSPPISQIYPTGTYPSKIHIGIDESGILRKMFLIHFYDAKMRWVLEQAMQNLALSVESDGQSITLMNRNTIAQSYLQAKRVEIDELRKLVNGYLRNRSTPQMVAGDDTVAAWAYGDVASSTRESSESRFYDY